MPTILYNVPSRTGVNLSISAIEELAKADNIVGIKEASDSIDRLTALSVLSEKIALYSGNDSQIYPTLSLGGLGVISVVSNAFPNAVKRITESYFRGDTAGSLSSQKEILAFTSLMFAETNPSPVKYALSVMGLCEEELRLPLTPPSDAVKKKINESLMQKG